MLGTLMIVLTILIIAILAYAATRPNTFRVERSTGIDARPEQVFRRLNDLHQWKEWSPWEKMDPEMKKSFKGSDQGQGAIYEWQGNNKVGQGRIEIVESNPPHQITYQLHFLRPFKADNTAEFSLVSEGERTRVTWAMYGTNAFIAKLFGVFVNMDKMLGRDFETGLANLKAAIEQ